MSNTLAFVVSVLSMIGALMAAVYAGRSADSARTSNEIAQAAVRFQVLLPVLFEYRSAEMQVAIRSLWDFSRAHPDDLAEAYKLERQRDHHDLAALKGIEHLNHLRTTLDFHRRQVSQFYAFLTSVYDEGGSQRKWIYTHWGKSDLAIIPRVIVPMEKALMEILGAPTTVSPTLDRLLRLYRESPG